ITTRSLERRRLAGQATLEKRVALYEDFVSFMARMFAGDQPSESETLEFFRQITPRLIAYSSNDVIKKWGRLRVRYAGSTSPDLKSVLFEWENLLKAMRKDLGYSASTLARGDILRLTVNDIDDY